MHTMCVYTHAWSTRPDLQSGKIRGGLLTLELQPHVLLLALQELILQPPLPLPQRLELLSHTGALVEGRGGGVEQNTAS